METNDLNLNNTYCATLDENFKIALELMEQNLSHEELIEMLISGNIPQKQLAALKLETLNSQEDAQILINNLTGQDGKIREAVSLKIKEFMSIREYLKFFENLDCYNIFLEAIIDINGNICRNIIDAVTNLKENDTFCSYFCENLVTKTKTLLDTVKDFNIQDGKYKINKEVFKLYWCLETIYNFAHKIPLTTLKEILLITKDINDYTIREKTAKILSLGFEDRELSAAREELRHDPNYYVRRY